MDFGLINTLSLLHQKRTTNKLPKIKNIMGGNAQTIDPAAIKFQEATTVHVALVFQQLQVLQNQLNKNKCPKIII